MKSRNIVAKDSPEYIEQEETFFSEYRDRLDRIAEKGDTVDDIFDRIRKEYSILCHIYPQSEPYKAFVSYHYIGELCELELEYIASFLDELDNLEVQSIAYTPYNSYLEEDKFAIIISIGNITHYDEQYEPGLLYRAMNNNSNAFNLLGCNFRSYYDGCDFRDDRFEPAFNTEEEVYSLFVNSTCSVPHLKAFACAFKHGLVVDKDERMARILEDCAKKAEKIYTEEELEDRYNYISYTDEQYFFLSDDKSDRQYVFDRIVKMSQDGVFCVQALTMLAYYYEYGIECEADCGISKDIHKMLIEKTGKDIFADEADIDSDDDTDDPTEVSDTSSSNSSDYFDALGTPPPFDFLYDIPY